MKDTELRSANFYIARDPDDSQLIAVYEHVSGRHKVVKGELRTRAEAEAWIDTERAREVAARKAAAA